jgi:hypothetical protein
VDAVHRHSALAGIKFWQSGVSVMNRTNGLSPISRTL